MDLEKIKGMLSNTFGSNFSEILVTLLILIVGIIVAKFIRNLFVGIFRKSSFNKKLKANSVDVDVAGLLGQFVFYIILLMVMLVVLERMGITSVLKPLENLVDQFFSYIPKLLAAGIIFCAGWILAKVAQSIVQIATVKLDQWIVNRNLGINFKASKFLSTFVFAIVFLPLAIQGFDALDFATISVPAKSMLSQLFEIIFRLIGAAVVVGVTYYIAKLVVTLVTSLLDSLSVNDLPAKLGMQSAFPKGITPVALVGKIVMFFIMLTAFTTAVNLIGIEILSNVFAKVLDFGGNLLMGGVIIFIGAALANLAYKKISLAPDNKFIASIARFAILGLVLSMGLKAMGLADNIVTMAFGLTLGAVAVSSAIAFGVGGIDAAKTITSHWASKIKK